MTKKNIMKKDNKKSFVIFLKTYLLIFIKFFQNSYFTFIDIIYLAYLILNLKNSKEAKNKTITIVTAADKSHYESVKQLVSSVQKTNKEVVVYFYDLEIDSEFKIEEIKYKNFVYRKFDFSNYPSFFSKKYFSEYDNSHKLGYYAWKGVVVNKVANEIDGILIWCDAGNVFKKKLSLVKKLVNKKKFYSPISSNRVVDWTYPTLIRDLNLSDDLLRKRNLWSCFVCFDLTSQLGRDMANYWSEWSQKQNLIAPVGSNRFNHRQDQTLITLLYYKLINQKLVPKTYKIFGLRFQQDIEIQPKNFKNIL